MEFYTYIWRDASGVPFYVGKGKGKRAHNTKQRSKEFKEIYTQGGCAVEIVDWFIHESQAHAHEVELIELYGRRDFGGTLVNKTDGGEGISGLSAEGRAKISASKLGKKRGPLTDEHRARMSAALTGKPGKSPSAEARAKISAALTGRPGTPHTNETRAKMSANAANRPPEYYDRVTAAKTGKKREPFSSEWIEAMCRVQRMKPPRDGFKGVCFDINRDKWMAKIKTDDRPRHLGRFPTPEEAARAYDRAALEAWGFGNCYLNFPEEFELKEAA